MLDFSVFSTAASLFNIQRKYFNESVAYNAALSFEKDPEIMYKAALTYYKLYRKSSKEEYLKKAESSLKEALYYRKEKKYYFLLALCQFELGKIKEASFYAEQVKGEEFKEFDIESLVKIQQLRYKEDISAYEILESPLLIDLYNFIKPYIIESGGDKLFPDPLSESLAKEIKKLYSLTEKFEDLGINTTQKRSELVIYFLLKGIKSSDIVRELNDVKEHLKDVMNNGYIDLNNIPPYTRNIIRKFRRSYDLPDVDYIPYLLEKELIEVEKLSKSIDKVSRGEGDIEFLKGKKIKRREAYTQLIQLLIKKLSKLKEISALFFDDQLSRGILKMTIKSLPLEEEEKEFIFSKVL